MPYRLSSKQLFLTYPQCTLLKEEAFNILFEILKEQEPTKWIMAHEKHANGDDHLHAYFLLDKKLDTRNPNYLDLTKGIETWHGNYQGCRSNKNVIKYCSKEDDYLSNFDVHDALNKSKNRRTIAEEIILKKRPLVDLVQEYPDLLFGLTKLEQDVDRYWRLRGDERLPLPGFLPNPWNKVLPSKIKGKKRHYWIFSRMPNQGKTYHFARPLNNEFRITIKTSEFVYWDLKGDEEGVVLDEYNSAMLKFNQLNSMCDGNYDYRIFHGGVKKLKDPLIIVLSNCSILELYPFMNHLLYARFKEIEIT